MYPTKKLWEVCELIMWQSPKSETYNSEWIGLPFFQWKKEFWEIFPTPEIFCSQPIKIAEKWDILISLRAPVGPTNIANEKCCIWRWLWAIRARENFILSKYFLKFLKKFEKEISELWKWSTFSSITKADLENLPIPLPPLSTQKLIVEKLDMIFVEIEKSKNLLQKNLQNVDEMNKSVLEKIFSNEEWERKKLWEVCEVIWWWTPKTEISEYWWEDIIWLSPTDLPEVWEITKISNSTKKISILWLQNSSAKLLPVWSVIFSSRATIGKIAINDIELSTNQGFTNFVCSGWVYNYFLAYALKNFTKDIIALSNSTTFKEVNKTNLRNFSIPLPPLETQKNIVSYLDNIFAENQKLKNLYQAQIKNLDEMKQSFLKKAFAGELV